MRVVFLTDRGVLSVVIGYGPTEQSSEEEKDIFYQLLDEAMERTGSLTIL